MKWEYTLDLKTTLREVEDMAFADQQKRLVETLKKEAEKLPDVEYNRLKPVMINFAECIGLCEDKEEVNAILGEVYDFADAYGIWLGL